MSEQSEQEESNRKFKVVDRRRFTSEGEMRPEAKEREAEEREAQARRAAEPVAAEPVATEPVAAEPVAAASGAPSAAAASPLSADVDLPANKASTAPTDAAATGEQAPEQETAIPFGAFLQSLAQQCIMQLGMIPFPSGQRQLDLEGARDTVDILSMLKVKTKGNLNAEEAAAFEQILYELRMTYMEVANKVAAAGTPGEGVPPGS